ncbi:ketopantoate reductase family protein [Desulfoscipio geothermicus]|uniref:2-dehydropantoate 2-reductase n=1 Tax=Desulfoscipio geothermicus DSM 3669 TaxID=1121426 RepID=A0A1I6DLX6_9FIRM|nr:ketopantoate reductase family protein [Desulfoscipio geothermicus]SFR06382.1 2-dehydropantoate 2-reductase [Desulfoscipio geothermicus DSM 3669]
MKIAVIGAGAMGSLFGAYLAGGGHQVALVDVWREHVEMINKQGLRIEEKSGEKIVSLTAEKDTRNLGAQDLVIIFVKSYNTADAVNTARNLFTESTVILTLQNGLGNAEIIADTVRNATVLAGTTAHGATVLGPGYIRHAGVGETIIGIYKGAGDRRVHDIADTFTNCGIKTRVVDDIASQLWGKLLINIGINPLTALLNVTNGRLVEYDATCALMQMLVSEGEAVARAGGINIPYADVLEKVKQVAVATGTNRSSMLQDLDKGGRTEIDFINGAVVREGAKLGISTPYNEMVTQLIKAVEAIREFNVNNKQ